MSARSALSSMESATGEASESAAPRAGAIAPANDKCIYDGGNMCPSKLLQVAVLGQGLLGTALVTRLERCASATVQVYAGSSTPGANTLSYLEAIAAARIVILAIPAGAHKAFAAEYGAQLNGRILVDPSNGTGEHKFAYERLVAALPGCSVVKGLNTISAYALDDHGYASGGTLPICGADADAKRVVLQLIAEMGLTGTDVGGAGRAQHIEALPLTLFSRETWISSIIALIVLFFAYWYAYIRYIVVFNGPPAHPAYHGLLWVMNKGVCWAAITVLSLSFMPGPLVQLLQLWTGRAYVTLREPLATAMGCRKALGLWAAFFVANHFGMSCMLMNQKVYKKFYVTEAGDGHEGWLSISGELSMLLGTFAATLLGVMTLASMPGAAAVLSWREYHFIFSYLGWLALAASTWHVIATSYPKFLRPQTLEAYDGMPTVGLLSIIPPMLAMALKLAVLAFTPRLNRIKRGGQQRRRGASPVEVPVNAKLAPGSQV
eukprot:TRINITY_DN10953_c0_g1_i1.p1 TRINITY_DN10953_c0_g1~~TRINITY_DN10953_c0_g1_i1.p1  ORF type:complete len:491 (+),score=152.72 TRINITY_DN10953_c0_g1_i1:155-1627(+)